MLIDKIMNDRKDSAKVDQWQREILKYDQKLIKEGENSTRKARTIEEEDIALQLTDIEEHRYDFYNKLRAEVDGVQKEMLAYDQKIIEKENEYSVQRNRTVKEEEDIILNQWGGKKLTTDSFYQHLEDFFGPNNDFEYLKMTSPCKIIFNYTEEIIPEEYFISFYVIPLQVKEKKKNDYYKEVVVYVTSRDGKNVYVASLLTSDVIDSEDVEKKLQKEVCYYREGIATYYEDMKS